MKKNDFLFILYSFLIWRVLLFVFLFLAVKYIPLQQNYLGGGRATYLTNPWLWSWLNFDGEHYLAIAQAGYQPLSYFFFPVLPLVTRFIGNLVGQSAFNYAVAGLAITNISFFVSLVGLWKLMSLDFSKKIVRLTILLMLFFPTSFYFASFYTESIFMAIVVWSFYFARRNKLFWASALAGVASATRIIGSVLAVSLFARAVKDKNYKYLPFLILAPIGIISYMYFLYVKTGDPLNFLNTISVFGPQRSSSLILLPQVFYRYFFKIIPSVNYLYLPVVLSTYLELITGILFFVLSVVAFWKLKIEYALYLALGYLIPTLSGSFSSMPRYVLVLFPGFIIISIYVSKLPRIWQIAIFSVLFISLGLAAGLFVRGFWVA